MKLEPTKKNIALVTPTYTEDLERFRLLCESIDTHVNGFERHYVVVADADVSRFAEFSGAKRVILPYSKFVPHWLKLLPHLRWKHGRRIWWSYRTGLIHGWHLQQVVKLATAAHMPEERYCIIDSDNVFFRPFDVSAYAGSKLAPLFVNPRAIEADAPLHSAWTKNCQHLLGLHELNFPADDYIGQNIVWDKTVVQSLLSTIEKVSGLNWIETLCRTKRFSEYLLYGTFVQKFPDYMHRHLFDSESITLTYWDAMPLNESGVRKLLESAPATKVALSVSSRSNTPLSAIRDAVGFLSFLKS